LDRVGPLAGGTVCANSDEGGASTLQPDASSAIRLRVASPSRPSAWGDVEVILVSSARRSGDPGGGGGLVFGFDRVGPEIGEGGSGAAACLGLGSVSAPGASTLQPDARSAIRLFVASPRRRRDRSSSSGTRRR
jgi:hypothetical protein